MPVSLRQQRTAVETARKILLGSASKPRASERDELVNALDEAAHTLTLMEVRNLDLDAVSGQIRQGRA